MNVHLRALMETHPPLYAQVSKARAVARIGATLILAARPREFKGGIANPGVQLPFFRDAKMPLPGRPSAHTAPLRSPA